MTLRTATFRGVILFKKIAVLIDGGHLRAAAYRTKIKFDINVIEKVAHNCRRVDEDLFRILYYDCPAYTGEARLPISGRIQKFNNSNEWLDQLASKDYFATRLGVLKFRGFKPKKQFPPNKTLTDDDFVPDFEQKGVDMKIGLDIAAFCTTKSVDRIVLVTNDTDCIPAMKYGRRAGLQIMLSSMPGQRPAPELLHHADGYRPMTAWPD